METTKIEKLEKLADRIDPRRTIVKTREELFDLIEPTTPDRVLVLDKKHSIFRGEWWIGNGDAFGVAIEEIAILLASPNLVPLTNVTFSGTAEKQFAGFCFAFTDSTVIVSEGVH